MKIRPILFFVLAYAFGLVGCVTTSQQDQFGHAVMTGNTQLAKQSYQAGYGRMRIYPTGSETPVTPIDYAIYQNNKELATFLVQNGCEKSFDGKNLVYYAAQGGNMTMANHFISLGEGTQADIEQVAVDREVARKQEEKQAAHQIAGFLLLGSILNAMSAGQGDSDGGSQACYSCGVDIGYGGGNNGLCGPCTAGTMVY